MMRVFLTRRPPSVAVLFTAGIVAATGVMGTAGFSPNTRQTMAPLPVVETTTVTLRIGGSDGGGHQLIAPSTIAGPSVLIDSGGRILVAQPREGQLLVFAANGALATRIGRSGQGPGEFRNIYSFGLARDTIWASNYPNRQLHRFQASGAYISTTSFASVRGVGSFSPAAYLAGGRAFFRVETADIPDAPESLKTAYAELVFAVAAEGVSVIDTIARRRPNSAERATLRRPNGELATVVQPLRQNSILAVAPDGDEVVLVERTGIAGNLAHVSVTRIRTRDGTSQNTRIALAANRVPPGIMDSIVRDRAARAFRLVEGEWPSLAAAERAYGSVITAPEVMPSIDAAMISADGYLWLRLAASEEWLVLNPSSVVSRRVRLPAGTSAKVAAVARDAVLTKDVNRDGEPQIVRHTIVSWRR